MELAEKKGRKIRSTKVSNISKKLKDTESLVINDYRGLTVKQITELRRELAKTNAKMHIQKNKLTKIALAQAGFPKEINEYLVGPSAITYINGDVSPALKILFKYSKDDAYPFSVKGAYFAGQVMNSKTAEQVSKLPSKNVLIAQLMATMQAPIRYMAVGLKDIPTRLARVLQALQIQKNK